MYRPASLTAAPRLIVRAALTAATAQPSSRPLPPSARFTAPHGHAPGAGILEMARSNKGRNAAQGHHFTFPYGLAADPSGNVYVTNFNANSVSVIKPTLLVTNN